MPSVRSVVAPVADHVLVSDLPGLPAERRRVVVGFVCRRVEELPDLTRLGVMVIATLFRALFALPAGGRIVMFLAGRPIPLLGEYIRLLRSLTTAYVWETWPDTAPDGTPVPEASEAA